MKLWWAHANGTGLTFGAKAWSATDIRLLGEDRRSRQAAEKILADAAQIVLEREADAPPRIERALADRIERLAIRFETRASPELREAFAELRQDLRQAVSKTAREAMRWSWQPTSTTLTCCR